MNQLVEVLSLFKNPNKYLIYSQNLIDQELHFENTNVFNYDYNFPILFYKYYFYDMEIINNKDKFIKLFYYFENILNNNNNVIHIKNNNIIEKYYIDENKMQIFKLTNIKFFSTYFINEDILFINNVINGYEQYRKINNIFEKINI